MRAAVYGKKFRRDYKRLKKSGRRNMGKLHNVMEQLIVGKTLHPLYKDHSLEGKWVKYRDCHIEGDWVLIYKIESNPDDTETITFATTDSHSNLFG